MTCGLSEEEIDVLFWFYSKHLLSEHATLHERAAYRRLRHHVPEVERVIKGLRTKGYIGMHKTMCLYADPKKILQVLGSHRASALPGIHRPGTRA